MISLSIFEGGLTWRMLAETRSCRLPSHLVRLTLRCTSLLLVAFGGVAADGWTPVPAGPDSIGSFRWQKDMNPDDVGEYIQIEWIPPAGGAPCQTTAMVQTCKEWFVLADGTIEDLHLPTDQFDGLDWSQFGPEGRKFFEDNYRELRESANPNTTAAGHRVDSDWCDEDPYYNGDDNLDRGKKGENGGKTSIADRPSRNELVFTGTRQTAVFEFEVSVYCFRANGTLGQPLASMKWRWERTKGGLGKVSILPDPSGPPSQNHIDAVNLFVRRHTRIKNHRTVKFCPDIAARARDPWEEGWELNERLKRMEDETEEAREGVRRRIKAIFDEIRRLRGR